MVFSPPGDPTGNPPGTPSVLDTARILTRESLPIPETELTTLAPVLHTTLRMICLVRGLSTNGWRVSLAPSPEPLPLGKQEDTCVSVLTEDPGRGEEVRLSLYASQGPSVFLRDSRIHCRLVREDRGDGPDTEETITISALSEEDTLTSAMWHQQQREFARIRSKYNELLRDARAHK